ncbi:MAG: enolase C-terminal domain-like protein [Planctomycetaceae bacterium]
MRLTSLTARHVRIPLKRSVKHASQARCENDTLVVRAELDDGTVGWGEGLPRTYVTGETIDSCFATLASCDLSQFGGTLAGLPEVVERCRSLRLPDPPSGMRDCFGNTLRCAVELAVLDAATRQAGLPLSGVADFLDEAASIRQGTRQIRYGTAITSVKPWKEAAAALAFRLYGFRQCKVKVGVAGQDEPASLRRIRLWAGLAMDLRVDANEGWSPDEVERRVAALSSFGITAVEQPVAHEHVGELASLRPRLIEEIVLDESLCSQTDADRAIGEGLCDLFNIRLSKCGGLVNSLLLAAKAKAAGLGYQLGCMVGETGILSAAGRHFACSVAGIRYLEGSFDRHLVAETLTREDLTFGRGGLASALDGSGLGITIDETAVERVTIRREKITLT